MGRSGAASIPQPCVASGWEGDSSGMGPGKSSHVVKVLALGPPPRLHPNSLLTSHRLLQGRVKEHVSDA